MVVEVLDDPGEHAGRRVLRREQHADDVVGDLLVGEERAVVARPRLHEAAEEVAAGLPPRPPLPHDVAQHACLASAAYLDRLVVQRPGEAVGEGVVALLHDGVVLPQLRFPPLVQPPAEDGHDADIERESSWRGRCWRRCRPRRRAWSGRRPRRPARARAGRRGREGPGRACEGGGGSRPGGRRAPTGRSSAPCSAGTSA
ncbi:Os09g0457250 [Oryza sativa Japonica Group]|uniref:Os09g0457250 protein n=1 Tax=Oryza sativa subsp. japonica TaxID=39947 RepID=A0A0P0XP06_ORYSJ|nr:hypothetical protein EE612_048283 [Oryza sativa]BAT08440.1 Os09g0457250 [Oryza sativa Japonica Group]